MKGARPTPRLAFGPSVSPGERMLPEEVAVALSFNGTTQAVMMATPEDLVDFGYGFALTEGIATPSEILSVEVETLPKGRDIQLWLAPEAEARLKARRRTMTGPVGCGLCGIDSLDQALRDVPVVPPSPFRVTPAQVMAAVAALPDQQRLHDATRAVHCAAFWNGRIALAREDVGRHNALDKLVGAMVRGGTSPQGAVVLTSRVSIDRSLDDGGKPCPLKSWSIWPIRLPCSWNQSRMTKVLPALRRISMTSGSPGCAANCSR